MLGRVQFGVRAEVVMEDCEIGILMSVALCQWC